MASAQGTTIAVARQPRVPRPIVAGLLWAAVTVVIFSGWFVVTRFSVTRELGIWDIAILRFGVGAVLLSPSLFSRGLPLPLAAWRSGLIFALLWGAPFVLLISLGLQLTSAAEAASMVPTLMPVFAALFAWLFLRQAQGRARWLGYGTIVLGVVCLSIADIAAHGAANPLGIAVLLLASASWAVYTLLFRGSGLSPIQSAALICVWSTLLILPVYLIFDLGRLGLASAGEIALQAGYQGVLVSGVAIVSFNRAVTLLGPAGATAIIALIPTAAAALAAPILGEAPTAAEGAAMAVITLGVLLAARASARNPASPEPKVQP